MALLGMAVYDTADNQRSKFTHETIHSLLKTVDFSKHTLIVVDNNSCKITKDFYSWLRQHVRDNGLSILVDDLNDNYGTAYAVNVAMTSRGKDEFFIKLDNDVVFHKNGWVDEMEQAMIRMPKIGVLGLKRKDVCESTYALNPDQRSRLLEVPHSVGERWYVVEQCKHVMGTCTMLSPALIKEVGFFYQMDGLYGFDDSLMCVRATKSGFINCFMHGIEIDHIDPGGTDYTKWKEEYARNMIGNYAECEREILQGTRSVYYNPFNKNIIP